MRPKTAETNTVPVPAPTSALPLLSATTAHAERLLRGLEWTVIRRLDGVMQGDYRTLMRGNGMDLADLREYQPHDDVRHIDWNVTARLDSPHVRVFTEDREMAAWFLLDLSPSVQFGPPGHTKRDVLTGFVAVLSRLLTRRGSRVGALLYGGGRAPSASRPLALPQAQRTVDTVLPPRSSRAHVLQLVHQLLMPDPTQQASPANPDTGGVTELHRLLQAALATVKRRSTVFVVSDFISTSGWEKPLAQLVQRHDVVVVRLLDPLELELPDVGLITLRDAESGEQLQVDTHDARFRRRFAELADQRESRLQEALARAGADTLEMRTDDDLLDALRRFMDMRRRRVTTPFEKTSAHNAAAPGAFASAAG